MSLPLAGVRVVELAQYVAGPLCGLLLSDLGADVVKVEPPHGDGYRRVVPVGPGLGRYFVALNRGKRSVVLDLKEETGRERCTALLGTADIVLHNYDLVREERFGLGWDDLHALHPRLVVGVVSSFGSEGPLAGRPAYDLVAQAHAGLLTAHAARGDRVPVRAGGIPVADLTSGLLLAAGVLAAFARTRESGVGERVEASLLGAALGVQLQDVLRLPGDEAAGEPRIAVSGDLDRRAGEIEQALALDPYYRCYAALDGFVAVACLNRRQREALLGVLGLSDPTVAGQDVARGDPVAVEAREAVTRAAESALASLTVEAVVALLGDAGVPCGPVHAQATALGDPQAVANGLVASFTQPELGEVLSVGRLLRVGDEPAAPPTGAAPRLGADTEAVLGGLS